MKWDKKRRHWKMYLGYVCTVGCLRQKKASESPFCMIKNPIFFRIMVIFASFVIYILKSNILSTSLISTMRFPLSCEFNPFFVNSRVVNSPVWSHSCPCFHRFSLRRCVRRDCICQMGGGGCRSRQSGRQRRPNGWTREGKWHWY